MAFKIKARLKKKKEEEEGEAVHDPMSSPSRGRSVMNENGLVGARAWSHPTGLLQGLQLSEQ